MDLYTNWPVLIMLDKHKRWSCFPLGSNVGESKARGYSGEGHLCPWPLNIHVSLPPAWPASWSLKTPGPTAGNRASHTHTHTHILKLCTHTYCKTHT